MTERQEDMETTTHDVQLINDDELTECAACGSPGPAGECDFDCPTLDEAPGDEFYDEPPGDDFYPY
jgi:hypothetical protein